VGYYSEDPQASNAHYTSGGPYFAGYEDCEHADAWRAERESMLRVEERRK
jgi:hypothetical protein